MRLRILCFLALFGGCADDSSPTPPATIDPGVRGTFAGTAHVMAVDRHDGEPIVGAIVLADGIDVGRTGADGRLAVEADAIDRIEVQAPGYFATAFVGAQAELLTLPLEREIAATAEYHGTVALPGAAEVPAGAVLFTRVSAATSGEHLAVSGATLTQCAETTECAFNGLAVPGARTTVFAQFDAYDDGGTPDDAADDVITPLGFAVSAPLVAEVDAPSVEVVLDPVHQAALAIDLPDLVPGTDRVVGVPGVGVESATMVLGNFRGQTAFALPQATGALATSRCWAFALASGEGVESASVARAAAGETPARLAPPALPAPASPSIAGTELTLGATDAVLVEVWDPSASRRTFVFDERATIEATAPAAVYVWHGPAQTDGLDLATLHSTFTGRTRARAE